MAITKVTTTTGETRYEVQARDANGKQLGRRFTSMREARTFEREVADEREAARNGDRLKAENPTLAEWIDRFLAAYPHSPRSARALAERLKPARKTLGETRLRDLDWAMIGNWLRDEFGERAPTTQRGHLKALRQVLNRAVKDGILRTNPAGEVAMPKLTRRNLNPFNSWAEVERVAENAGTHSDLIRLGAATGLRPQELFALKWRDIDREARTLTIRRTIRDGRVVEGTAKTDGSLRSVPLQQRALDAIPWDEGGPDELLFGRADGKPYDLHRWRNDVWYPALEAAGVARRGVNQLRHTFATLAMTETNAPIHWISRALGHKDVSTTQNHYLAYVREQDDYLIELLDQGATRRLRVVA